MSMVSGRVLSRATSLTRRALCLAEAGRDVGQFGQRSSTRLSHWRKHLVTPGKSCAHLATNGAICVAFHVAAV